MKTTKSIVKGAIRAILLALAVYFILYGIQATGVLRDVPVLSSWLASRTNHDIVLISTFIGIFYFAFVFLNKILVTLLAAAVIFVLFFQTDSSFSQVIEGLKTFVNNILNLFTS